jgi:calcineurin-like phosphoesterase family protein
MSTTWFTSDTHFTHERVVSYDKRPFRDAAHMDRVLIDNWNDRVDDDDEVWHLGDFSNESGMEQALGYLRQLKGHKRLITGNHDKCWPGKIFGWKFQRAYLDAGFEVVLPWAQIRIGSVKVNLSHFPYMGDHLVNDRDVEWRLPVQAKPILHGHVHTKFRKSGNQINVGVDAWDFAPVSAATLEQLFLSGRDNVSVRAAA